MGQVGSNMWPKVVDSPTLHPYVIVEHLIPIPWPLISCHDSFHTWEPRAKVHYSHLTVAKQERKQAKLIAQPIYYQYDMI